MTTTAWNPTGYLTFGEERLRPARDLLARVPLEAPRRIADLGCGPGNATGLLAERWPGAALLGIDSTPEMLARARTSGVAADWLQADLDKWTPGQPYDLLFANAVFQWLDGHETLFSRLMGFLRPGGALAVQMPCNFAAPSHKLLRETAASGPWTARLQGVLREDPVAAPDAYFALLSGLAKTIDIWQTDYLHVLEGADPVLAWTRGTALRPVMDALDREPYAAFEQAYAARLRAAYPQRPDGITLFPFRRLFLVALAKA